MSFWFFGKDLQRIRESDEDFEVTSNEIRCKGHCNSKSQGLNEAIFGRTYGIIDDIWDYHDKETR